MFHSLKTVLSLASLTSAAAFYDNVIVERQTTCATGLHLMIGGGCAIPCPADVPSLLSTLISNITYAFPGTDQYYVPYNNDLHQAATSTVYMIAAFNAYVAQCPQTPIVFIGYSLGGIVTMNTLCGGVSESYAPNVIAAITYGEETFRNGLSYDAGTCTQPAPNYPRNNTDQCAPYAAAIQDYCDSTDPNCCKGGNDAESHYTYPEFYDLKALAFIQSRYAALAVTSTAASSSTAHSTSTSTSTGTVTVSTTLSTAASTVVVSTTVSSVASTAASVSTAVSKSSVSTNSAVVAGTQSTAASASGSASASASAASTSASASAASASVSTIPHYSIPAVSGSTIIPAVASTFPTIPNSAILVPSSVYASYISNIPTTIVAASNAASTASAVAVTGTGSAASGTATGSKTGTATTAAVTAYTGAATRQIVSGLMGFAAGIAACIVV